MNEIRCNRHGGRPLADCPRECLVNQLRGVVYYAPPGKTEFHIFKDDGWRPPVVWCGSKAIPHDLTGRFTATAPMTGKLTDGQTCCPTCAIRYAEGLGIDADPEVLEHWCAHLRDADPVEPIGPEGATPQFKGQEMPPLPEGELREVYDLTCPVCATTLGVRPGLSMHSGWNSGHGTCPRCRTFLHLEITADNERMDAIRWDDYQAAGYCHRTPAAGLRDEVRQIADTHAAAFEELRRRGD
jgi:hypothetical protein